MPRNPLFGSNAPVTSEPSVFNSTRQNRILRRNDDEDPEEETQEETTLRDRMETFKSEIPSPGAALQDELGNFVLTEGVPSEERRRELSEQGKIPIAGPNPSFEEFEPIDIDFSGQKDALREFAQAKINAAKKGAKTGRKNVAAANSRLLANAFGPGLFQAISGVQQPTNQTTNYAASAARAGREARQAQLEAEQTEALAEAEVGKQIAQLNEEERIKQAEDERTVRKLNNQMRQNQEAARREAFNGMISKALQLSEEDQSVMRKLALSHLKTQGEDGGREFSGNQVAAENAVENLKNTQKKIRKLRGYLSTLRNPKVTVTQKQDAMRQLRDLGYVRPDLVDMANKKRIKAIQDRIQDLNDYKQSLTNEVRKYQGKLSGPQAQQIQQLLGGMGGGSGGNNNVNPRNAEIPPSADNVIGGSDNSGDNANQAGTTTDPDTTDPRDMQRANTATAPDQNTTNQQNDTNDNTNDNSGNDVQDAMEYLYGSEDLTP